VGFKIDAYYMRTVDVPTDDDIPTVHLSVETVGIDSDRIDAEMRAVESQEGFKKWLPGPRDVLRQQLQRMRNALQGELHGVHYHEVLALWKAANKVRGYDELLNRHKVGQTMVDEDFTARPMTDDERQLLIARACRNYDEAVKQLIDEVAALRSRTIDVMFDLYGVDVSYRPPGETVPEAFEKLAHAHKESGCHYCEAVPECRSPWGHWLFAKLDLSSWGL
jgi:hypothetical protein